MIPDKHVNKTVFTSNSFANFTPMSLLRRLRRTLTTLTTLLRRARYPGGIAYWEKRYAAGGDSGAGSSGRLAAYKAAWLNRFVQENDIRSVVEFGCGDGRQLQLARYPQYLGLDVAPSAIARCRALFAGDDTRQFAVYDPRHFDPALVQADLALSLEVIFHLTEESVYRLYMEHLFAGARRYVVIFASDTDMAGPYPHFRQRRFTADVPPGWVLQERVENPHRNVSVSDFFVFVKPSARRLEK